MISTRGRCHKGSRESAVADANSEFQGYYHDTTGPLVEEDWLSRIDGQRRFSTLSLPGAHDSIARDVSHWGGPHVKTQSMDLREQLKIGIRAFDIRLKCKYMPPFGKIKEGYVLEGYHGGYDQRINLDEILYAMSDFLDKHQKEALFVRVKNEENSSDIEGNDRCEPPSRPDVYQAYFRDIFSKHIGNYPKFILQPKGDYNPKLDDVRGKIVIMQVTGPDKGIFGIPFGQFLAGKTWSIQDDFYLQDNWVIWEKYYTKASNRYCSRQPQIKGTARRSMSTSCRAQERSRVLSPAADLHPKPAPRVFGPAWLD